MNREPAATLRGWGRAMHSSRLALIVAAVLLAGRPAYALDLVHDARGHLSVGYGKLFVQDAPGGSVSFGAGVDTPINDVLRVGIDIDYHLFGTSTIVRDPVRAEVDYSLFDADAALNWEPENLWHVHTISLLAGVYAAHATIGSETGGNTFLDVPRDEIVPGGGFALTFLPKHEAPVRLGFEFATHVVFLAEETWTVVTARAAVHY